MPALPHNQKQVLPVRKYTPRKRVYHVGRRGNCIAISTPSPTREHCSPS